MNSNRKDSTIVGALFITPTVAGILSLGFLKHIDTPDYLIQVSETETQFLIGLLLILIMAIAVVGITIAMCPILRIKNEIIALGMLLPEALKAFYLLQV